MYKGEIVTPSSEVYINRQLGQVFIGKYALEQELEMCYWTENDIPPLHQVLVSETERNCEPVNPPVIVEHWERPDYLAYGSWILAFLQPDPQKANHKEAIRPNTDVVKKLREFRLGPNQRHIRDEFGRFADLALELGFRGERRLENNETTWTREAIITYAKNLQRFHKIRHIDKAFRRGTGPPISRVRELFGGNSELFATLGYNTVKNWTQDDFIDWGVQFMYSNDGIPPTQTATDTLSKRRRGPAAKTVRDNLKIKWSTYKDLVIARYEEAQAQVAETKETMTAFLETNKNEPIYERLYSIEDAELRIKAAAQARILLSLTKPSSEKEAASIARNNPTDIFIKRVREHLNDLVSVGDIEILALELGVYDILWPPKGSKLMRVYPKKQP